jgi:hypothetical protein
LVVLKVPVIQVVVEVAGIGDNVPLGVIGRDLTRDEHVQGCQALLAVEGNLECAQLLRSGLKVLEVRGLVSLPNEETANRIALDKRNQ